MLFSSWDTPSDACFNSMCNTNSLYNYIVIMFCICVIMHYVIDIATFFIALNSTFNSTFVNASMDNKLTYEERFLVYYCITTSHALLQFPD